MRVPWLLSPIVSVMKRLQRSAGSCPDLKTVVLVDGEGQDRIGFAALAQTPVHGFTAADTVPDDPAMMIYTSGTTGPPKGALHGHRVLLGHVPGFQFHHAFLPQPGDRMWTPADWAWAGGLLNALLPSLFLGVPVVSSPGQKFDPHMAFRILEEMEVRNAFIPPTALRLMKAVDNPRALYRLNLRTIGSAGESLGRETWEQARFRLRRSGQRVLWPDPSVISSCRPLPISACSSRARWASRHPVMRSQSSMKRARGCLPEPSGRLRSAVPDPVMFLGYWNNEAATAAKFIGDWMTTGDQGIEDEEGYITFFGRDDDVITSSGYRIGPGEIEDCLAGHPAVQLAAAIGKPDPVRTEIVKAYVVLRPDYVASAELAADIRDWVKTRLSMHEYPREIEFLDSLPLTTSGKVIRRLLRDRAVAEG